MGRAPCCDKANVKKGPWSPDEDAKLKSYIDQHGTGGNWITLPQKIGLKRCGKSCRLRWLNYLRPNIKHGGFSEEEDLIICRLFIAIGSRWSIIAAQLPGRTDNDIKNYWNTRLKKKLFGKQKDHRRQPRGSFLASKKEIKKLEDDMPLTIPNEGDLSTYRPEPIDPFVRCNQIMDHPSNPQYLYSNSTNPISPLDDLLARGYSMMMMSGQPVHQAADVLATEDAFYDNNSIMKFEGLDCFYGAMLGGSAECSLMIPPHLTSTYQVMQQY